MIEPFWFRVYNAESSRMEKIEISKNILVIGLVLLLAGFVVMSVGSEVNSFWKTGLAPFLIIAAFCMVVLAVMRTKKDQDV